MSLARNAVMSILEDENLQYSDNSKTFETKLREYIESGKFVPGSNAIPINLDDIIHNMDIPFGKTLEIIRESRRLSRPAVSKLLGISLKPLALIEKITDEDTAPGLNKRNVYKGYAMIYGLTKDQMVDIAKKNPYIGLQMWDTFWDEGESFLTVGKVLAIVRERKGITRQELSEKTGIIVDNISRMENKSQISSKNIRKILEVFDMTLLEFYETVIRESKKYGNRIKNMIID